VREEAWHKAGFAASSSLYEYLDGPCSPECVEGVSLLKNPLGGHFRLRRGTKYDDFGPLEPDLGLLSAHYQLNADFFNRLGYSTNFGFTEF